MKSETPNVCINSSKPLLMEFQTTIWWLVYPYLYRPNIPCSHKLSGSKSPYTRGKVVRQLGKYPRSSGFDSRTHTKMVHLSPSNVAAIVSLKSETPFMRSPNPFWEEIKNPKPLVKKLQTLEFQTRKSLKGGWTTFGWFKKIQTTFGWFKKIQTPIWHISKLKPLSRYSQTTKNLQIWAKPPWGFGNFPNPHGMTIFFWWEGFKPNSWDDDGVGIQRMIHRFGGW